MTLKELSTWVQEAFGGASMVNVHLNEFGAHVIIWDGQEDDPDRSIIAAASGQPLDVACDRVYGFAREFTTK